MGSMMGGGSSSSGASSSPAPAPNFDTSNVQAMEYNLAMANARQGTPLQTPQNPLTQVAPMFQGMNRAGMAGMPGGGGMAGGQQPPPQTPMGNSNPMMQAFQSGMNPF